MQKFAQKYTIICLLENFEEGYCFSSRNWPLHTTFIDTFAIDLDVETLEKILTEMTSKLDTTSTKAIGDEFFGAKKEVHVILLENNDDMKTIHHKLLGRLKKCNIELNDPQFSEEGYLPHVTVQKNSKVEIGDTVPITNLALIDMFPNEDPNQRKILKVIKLK